MLKAVIFDVDGVLVDSHNIFNKLFTNIANKELGINITEKQFAKFPGMRFEQRIELFCKKNNIKIDKEKIESAIEKGRLEYYTNQIEYVKLYQGIKTLLHKLKKEKILMGIASNGSIRSIDKLLTKFNIKEFFSSIVTYDDVLHGKPDPEMYFKNADNLKVKVEECVVIDDAVEGIVGAHSAGMKVIAVASTSSPKILKDADLIVKKIKDINVEKIKSLVC